MILQAAPPKLQWGKTSNPKKHTDETPETPQQVFISMSRGAARWVTTSYKWSYKHRTWPYKWVFIGFFHPYKWSFCCPIYSCVFLSPQTVACCMLVSHQTFDRRMMVSPSHAQNGTPLMLGSIMMFSVLLFGRKFKEDLLKPLFSKKRVGEISR